MSLGRLSVSVLALGLVLVATSACRKKDKTDDTASSGDSATVLAQDGTDASSAETDAELLVVTLVSASTTGGSLTLASSSELGGGTLTTQGIGDGAKALYFPRSCLTVTSDETAHTVNYAFRDCTGPAGLARVTGDVKATYAVQNGTLVLDLVGSDLKVNRATLDWSAHAEVVATGAQRSMTWRAQLDGTTARGREFTRQNQKTVGWRLGERCFSVDGTSEGTVKGQKLKTEISGFKRCQGECPEAGGIVRVTNVDTGLGVELRYNGTNRATFTTARGDSFELPLLCS